MADEEGLLLSPLPNVSRHCSASSGTTLFSGATGQSHCADDENLITGAPQSQPQNDRTNTAYGQSASEGESEIASFHLTKPGKTHRSLLPSILKSWYRRLSQSKFPGWRWVAVLGLWLSTMILVCNIVFLAVGGSRASRTRGMGILDIGTASHVAWTGTIYHVLINTFSTALLSVSNYCMQVVTAPTREQADAAHSAGHYVDIGVLSVHNLRYVGPLRRMLFWTLAISSIPLHLFYNSVVSDVMGGRTFTVTTLSDAYLGTFDAEHNHTFRQLSNDQWLGAYRANPVTRYGDLYLFADAYSFGVNYNLTTGKLSLSQASNKLPDSIQPWQPPLGQLIVPLMNYSRDHVLLDVAKGARNESMLPDVSLPGPFSPDYQNTSGFTQSSEYSLAGSGWLYFDSVTLHVKTAMAEEVMDSSKVEISLVFMGIVLACNIGKVCAISVLLKRWKANLLVTVGDGIASFLERPDPMTVGCCVAGKKSILRSFQNRAKDEASNSGQADTELTWFLSKFQLRKSMSRRRASAFLGILLTLLWSTLACLMAAFLRRPRSNNWQWGTASELTLAVTSSTFDAKSILINTWLANSPQVLLSASYFFTNSLLTTMYSAYEWNEYATRRKRLRVSTPEGEQRSQHFLQLPYRIAVPLTVFSGVLHWLLSQSLFLRRIDFCDKTGALIPNSSLCACGYSPFSLLVFAIIAFFGSIIIYVTCIFTFKQKIPFGANCSLIISAACHPTPDDTNPHLKPVQWGVVQNRFSSCEGAIKHCTFTSEPITAPEIGKLYA